METTDRLAATYRIAAKLAVDGSRMLASAADSSRRRRALSGARRGPRATGPHGRAATDWRARRRATAKRVRSRAPTSRRHSA